MCAAKGEPWAALVGNYQFDPTAQHAELLGRLAKIASQSAAPFLTSIDLRVLDNPFTLNPEAAPAWEALRQLPEAGLLGLALPRFLLRLPYGENTLSIDKFSYEEMSQPPDRSHYLWGNAALGLAVLLAQTFHREGWACKPGSILSLEDLPIHVFSVDGDEEVTLAEAWLLRPATEQLVKQGIMPFLCVRGKAVMQLARFLSLAQPAKDQPACDLRGRWNPLSSASAQKPTTPPPVAPAVKSPAPPAPVAKAPPAPSPPAPAPVAKAPPPPAEPEPAEEEMDPDLAALLKELG